MTPNVFQAARGPLRLYRHFPHHIQPHPHNRIVRIFPFYPCAEQWQEGEADGEGQGEGDQDGRAGGGSLRLHLQLNGANDHWSLRARCTDDPGAFGCRDINMSSPLCCLPGADCTMAAK